MIIQTSKFGTKSKTMSLPAWGVWIKISDYE